MEDGDVSKGTKPLSYVPPCFSSVSIAGLASKAAGFCSGIEAANVAVPVEESSKRKGYRCVESCTPRGAPDNAEDTRRDLAKCQDRSLI